MGLHPLSILLDHFPDPRELLLDLSAGQVHLPGMHQVPDQPPGPLPSFGSLSTDFGSAGRKREHSLTPLVRADLMWFEPDQPCPLTSRPATHQTATRVALRGHAPNVPPPTL